MAITLAPLTRHQIHRHRLGIGDGKLYVSFINVGQGDCTFLMLPDGKRVIVDCGSNRWGSSSPKTLQDAFPLFNLIGTIGQIDLVVFTHRDRDHYDKLPSLMGRDGGIGTLMHADDLSRFSSYAWRSWATRNWSCIGSVVPVTVNDSVPKPEPYLMLTGRYNDGPTYTLTCLASNVVSQAEPNSAQAINTRSLVTKVDFGIDTLILPGDATTETEDFMLRHFKSRLKSKVARVAHHGSPSSSSQPYVAAVSPGSAVVSVAQRNGTYRLPKKPVLDAWAAVTDATPSHDLYYYEDSGSDPVSGPYVNEVWETSVSGTITYNVTGT